jgi:putative ABC transport system permease protein
VRPDQQDFDDEIRGHLEIEIRERIDRGEDPQAARLAALRQFGYLPHARDAMRRVWYSRWFDTVDAFVQDVRVGIRSLRRAKGLSATVIITLALGIGANAAIFSVVRGVLLRPLVNRGEDRLIYIRQGAPGLGVENVTFSVPEMDDLQARSTTIDAFGDFSTIEFTMLGIGEPRVLRAGVVGGSYFDVMGLRPVLGRLLTSDDDGPGKASAVVLTHRFWTTTFNSDPSVIGKPIRLGLLTSTIVGVLEPSIPYPADTEIIANMVTSPHHLGATMNTERTHRMSELFGRLAAGTSVGDAEAELTAAYDAMTREHQDAYPATARYELKVRLLRDQVTAPARPILLLLLAAAAVVFVIACSNVANLIVARSIRREGELAVRAALGASHAALRRTLLAESLLLCGAGAVFGVLLARPLVSAVAQFAARFSVRALDVTVDTTVLWVGAGLAMAAAIVLAYVPRLPSTSTAAGFGLASAGVRITPGTNRRLRVFATTQIAFSFVLLAGAAMLVNALVALQTANTGYDTRNVLVMDVPSLALAKSNLAFTEEVSRRILALPGVEAVSTGNVVPWRDAGKWPRWRFAVEGYTPAQGEEDPFARPRFIGPGFFEVLGVPVVAGREFGDDDRSGSERVVIVSQTIAQRLFPNGDALNRKLWIGERLFKAAPSRIVGIVADVDDESIERTPAMTIYFPAKQAGLAERMFVRTSGDPHDFVPGVTRVIRQLSADQPVERAASLEDVRVEVLAPDRLRAFVLSGFAGVALLIAVVGVAGVLAFGVTARIREFGVRLAIGSTPRHLLMSVLCEGASIVAIGIAAGAAGGYLFAGIAGTYFDALQTPRVDAVAGAAVLLGVAAIIASLMPAARAARVDVLQALRSE